jgi:hypothetical protein
VDVPQATIVRALRVLADAASLARTGANPRLELETALLRFLLEEGEIGAPPAARRAPVEKAAAAPPKPAEVVAPPPVTPSVAGPVTLQKVRAAWQSIRGKVEAERPPLRAPLSGAMVDSIEGNAVVLKLRAKFDADILKEHTKLLESAIADVLGAPLQVRFETGAAPAAASVPAVGPTAQPDEESADELFGYANERIK